MNTRSHTELIAEIGRLRDTVRFVKETLDARIEYKLAPSYTTLRVLSDHCGDALTGSETVVKEMTS